MLVGREALHERIVTRAQLEGSTLLVGVPGVGTSAVLAAVASALDTAMVHGADAVEGVPFVPFAELLATSGVDPTDARTVYGQLATWLADRIIVVSDIERLDLASSVLLTHAVRAGARVVAGVSDLAALPPAFRELSASWLREEVPIMTDDDLLTMVAHRLGADVAPAWVSGLLSRSVGLPVIATDLVTQSLGHGNHTADGFDFRGFRPGPRSLALRGHRFDDLAPVEAELLTALVLAGRLPAAPTPSAQTMVRELVARGLAQVEDEVLRPAGELVIDVVLPRLLPDRWPHLTQVALAMVPQTEPWLDVRRRLLLLAGEYDAGAALEIGTWFLAWGRADLCLHLMSEHADRGEPAALLLRARAATAGDDVAAALADLDRAAVAADDPDLLTSIAQEWGVLLRQRLTDHAALNERILTLADRLPMGSTRDRVLAVVERRRAFAGGPPAAGRKDEGQDASTRALSTVMAGELHRAQQIMAESPQEALRQGAEFERTMRVLVEFLPVVYDGQMALARTTAEAEYRLARNRGGSAAGLWGYNRAKISLHSGQYHHTIELAVVAGKHLSWRDETGLAMPCLALRVAGLARVGRIAEAEALVAGFSPEERALPRIAIGIARVRAERRRAGGDLAGAAAELARAGRRAITDGETYSGVLALDESFMLNPLPEVAADLTAHAERSRLLELCAQRADAMLTDDIRAITAAAEALESLPMPGRAAHLWRTAARLQRKEGREAGSRAAQRHARTLAEEWGLPAWPELGTRSTERLTLREWQVARRAAARGRSREIAAELGLSVRTVDNHLAACFRKLGISSRDELSAALNASTAPVGLGEDVLDH